MILQVNKYLLEVVPMLFLFFCFLKGLCGLLTVMHLVIKVSPDIIRFGEPAFRVDKA